MVVFAHIGRCEAYEQLGKMWMRCIRSGEVVGRKVFMSGKLEVCLCPHHQEKDDIVLEEEL